MRCLRCGCIVSRHIGPIEPCPDCSPSRQTVVQTPSYDVRLSHPQYYLDEVECMRGCPVATDARGYIIAIGRGDYAEGPARVLGRARGHRDRQVRARRGAFEKLPAGRQRGRPGGAVAVLRASLRGDSRGDQRFGGIALLADPQGRGPGPTTAPTFRPRCPRSRAPTPTKPARSRATSLWKSCGGASPWLIRLPRRWSSPGRR